jgi:hypothetical protein
MLSWTDYPRKDSGSLSNYLSSAGYSRISDKFKTPSLLGNGADPYDIAQGALSDCYFVTAISAMAEVPSRISNIFLTNTYSKEGIFAVTLYIRGMPQVITIDDIVPFKGD